MYLRDIEIRTINHTIRVAVGFKNERDVPFRSFRPESVSS